MDELTDQDLAEELAKFTDALRDVESAPHTEEQLKSAQLFVIVLEAEIAFRAGKTQ